MALNKRCSGKTRDGYKVCSVDGQYVRDRRLVDFVGGGNHWAYPKLVPKDELWAERRLQGRDFRGIIEHERIEANAMRHRRWPYERAHALANREERKWRGQHRRR
jgi:hypothetical protein